MSQKARKERLKKLYEALLDNADNNNQISNVKFQEFRAKFQFEHGISQHRFFEYIDLFMKVKFLKNNFEEYTDLGKDYWEINPEITLSWLEE